ncbi:MAG: protein kinase [Pyrinomonadaceae bacterium]
MLAPESVLQGRYRIVGPLGEGGMGAVYEAVDERLDTIVALKETLFTDERLRKQFEREARLLARLHHQALPRVSDHFNEGEGQFLVMQFVAGEDLQAMLTHRNGPFPAAEVLKWADQLLDALDYLHTQDPQIIHRDIKPQNLKLTARGQIVLLDFGLAKGSAGQMSMVTTSASIFGYTPNYAPLEQVQGLGTDGRSDLYSLAATIYHLTTGMKPPDALSRAASLVNGQPDPLKPANEVAGQISPAVGAVLAKAMAQNREQRYPSAAEMREALRTAADSAATVTGVENATILMSGGATGGIPGGMASTAASEHLTALISERHAVMPTARQPAVTETVTRVHVPESKGTSAGWKAAIAAVVLLACAGIFYGYRVISNRAVSTAAPATGSPPGTGATPQPATESSGVQPALENPKDTNNPNPEVEPRNQSATRRSAPAKEPTPKRPESGGRQSVIVQTEAPRTPATPNEGGSGRSGNEIELPNPPNPNVQLGRDRRMPGGGTLRTLPDGTQILTQPDGTRIVRRPNGGTRVFGPGERLNQRPNRRRLPQ